VVKFMAAKSSVQLFNRYELLFTTTTTTTPTGEIMWVGGHV